MKKYCWILIVFAAQMVFSQTVTNATDLGKEINRDGKCFAKLPIHTYKTHEESYPIFSGEKRSRKVRLKKKQLILKEPISKWVKKSADRNCLSPDPNDCLVWCLVESVPGETAYFEYVKNTSKTTEYEMQTFTIYKKVKSKIEEVQIVCESKITKTLLDDIQRQLESFGYYEATKGKFNKEQKLKRALFSFQRDNSCLLYTSPSPRDQRGSRMPSSA